MKIDYISTKLNPTDVFFISLCALAFAIGAHITFGGLWFFFVEACLAFSFLSAGLQEDTSIKYYRIPYIRLGSREDKLAKIRDELTHHIENGPDDFHLNQMLLSQRDEIDIAIKNIEDRTIIKTLAKARAAVRKELR